MTVLALGFLVVFVIFTFLWGWLLIYVWRNRRSLERRPAVGLTAPSDLASLYATRITDEAGDA